MSPCPAQWTLDELETAYAEGLAAGLSVRQGKHPDNEVLAASWEAGWLDGFEQRRTRCIPRDAPFVEHRFPPLLEVLIQNRSARPPLGHRDFSLKMQRLVQP